MINIIEKKLELLSNSIKEINQKNLELYIYSSFLLVLNELKVSENYINNIEYNSIISIINNNTFKVEIKPNNFFTSLIMLGIFSEESLSKNKYQNENGKYFWNKGKTNIVINDPNINKLF